MSLSDMALPVLSDAVLPPVVLGTADLTHFAYQGHTHADVLARIAQFDHGDLARRYDTAIALQLAFRRAEGLDLLDEVLGEGAVVRVAGGYGDPLRLLAVVCPGDLMTNTPLDFLTRNLNVRLDLLYVRPNEPLPVAIPDHDVAFFAAGEADADMLGRLAGLYARWPRPALNNPAVLPRLERDTLAVTLAGQPGLCSPKVWRLDRPALLGSASAGLPYPCLIRPYGSHAGAGLVLVGDADEAASYARLSPAPSFFVTRFEDYAGQDGLYRKLRVLFLDRQPFLCHMAVSSHWMVHYLNAGMRESAAKRAEEEAAMAEFDGGFARRHRDAFAALHEALPFDCYSIDCAETPDGRLLVFEADTAAIVHAMDPPDLFPYKQPQMRRVFTAFEAMLRRRAERSPRTG